jgi:hypothetical protein
MNPSEKCRVDDCDLRAAASVIRENLPGPLPLCATHTEAFRMNSAGWSVNWEEALAEPTSVKVAAAAPVGRNPVRPDAPARSASSPGFSVRRRLGVWRSTRQ